MKGVMSEEVALCNTSTKADANKHLLYSRQYWAVENKLHWILDIVFNEDQSTLQAQNAAQNMAIIRRLVINMIKCYKQVSEDKIAIKTMRKASSWSSKSAGEVLKFMAANS